MRVLHVYSGNLYGGVEAILSAIAATDRARGAAVHEFALCFDGRLAGELRAVGAAVHPLGPARVSRPQTVRAARGALARLVAGRAFDRVVCHAPWSAAIFGGVVRRARLPLIFWAHDAMTGRPWTERVARRNAPDFVVANSAFTLGTLSHLYPAAAARVVHAPVMLGSAKGPATSRGAVRASLATPDGAVVVVQASRAEPWKGHLLLVEALAALRDVPGWVWWLIGGAQRPNEQQFLCEVKAAAADAGIAERVRWVGQRDDVPDLLRAADVYCQANLRPEPFGIAFVEALAAGLPVVTTDAGGAREIVDASCGVLVPPRSEALAAALRRLVVDVGERGRLSRAAPDRAFALCSAERQLARFEAAIEQAVPVGVDA